jgi:hypothetical protein
MRGPGALAHAMCPSDTPTQATCSPGIPTRPTRSTGVAVCVFIHWCTIDNIHPPHRTTLMLSSRSTTLFRAS